MKPLCAIENNDTERLRTVYCDHAATSFPKAPGTAEAVAHYLNAVGANLSRATYCAANEAAMTALETREQLASLFHFDPPSHAVFTPGCTYGLNTVINGYVRPGDRVIVTSLEHNAVMRPLRAARADVICLPCSDRGETDPDGILPLLQGGARLAIFTHASNVCGTLQPVAALAAHCRAYGVPVLLDAAQTAGHVPIDFSGWGLSALSVPGHKGLLGPAGIGALLLSPTFADTIAPLTFGGTGSASNSEFQPMYMPDRFESGTLNIPGIYGLHRALSFIEEVGVAACGSMQSKLTGQFLASIDGLDGVQIIGRKDAHNRVGVVSLDFSNRDNAEVARLLESRYGVLTRVGLHCAPAAHKALGTFPKGTVRFSFGYGSTAEDIRLAAEAVRHITEG